MNFRILAGATLTVVAILAVLMTQTGTPSGDIVTSPEALTASAVADAGSTVENEAGGTVSSGDIDTLLAPETPTTEFVPVTTTTTVPTPTTTSPPAKTTSTKSTATTVTPTTAAPTGSFNSSHESAFTSLINAHRAASGLAPLTRNGSLDSEARAWSQSMAAGGQLVHSDIGRFLPPWSSVGENLAVGGSVTSMFNALVASSGHNANMLGDYTHLGVGVWVDGSGTLWTTHIFTK